jgi:hypothetical protein
MAAYFRKKITFTEYKPDVITIVEMKKPINV